MEESSKSGWKLKENSESFSTRYLFEIKEGSTDKTLPNIEKTPEYE